MSDEVKENAENTGIQGFSGHCSDCGIEESADDTVKKVSAAISAMSLCANCVISLLHYAIKIKNIM